MRSTTPSPRRLRSRPPRHGRLEAIARVLDLAAVDEPGHVLVHVLGEPDDEVELGVRPLDVDVHPFQELAGLTAPEDWWAVGVRARGRATFLDDRGRPPERIATTYLLGRTGEEASLLRSGHEVSTLPGPATGTIPDACRRVLGLPTPPAPASTIALWTAVWLDRVLDAWGDPSRRRALQSSWQELALQHPAATDVSAAPGACTDRADLVPAAKAHATAWPWGRLRRDPHALQPPSGALPQEVRDWMDDGCFARWMLGAYPSLATLAIDLRSLLGDPLGEELVATVVELLE